MAGFQGPRGPGKTAPRLIEDLLDYDPRYRAQKDQRNLLAEDAPHFRESQVPAVPPRKGDFDCRHELMLKQGQTVAPFSADEDPDETTQYVVSTYCYECRWYFDIRVDYTQWKENSVACQLSDSENRLHHFRLVETIYPPQDENKYKSVAEIHSFVCSGDLCPCKVEIRISPPKLTPNLLGLILTASKVHNRGRKEIEAEPERYPGLGPLVPLQVLGYLRQYLIDARTGQAKRIAKRNKKYMLAFGPECEPLFEYLGFTSTEVESSEPGEGPSYFWTLPQTTDANREFLGDVEVELQLKIKMRPESEYQASGASRIELMPVIARKAIERSLRFVDYPVTARSRTVDLSVPSHPHYASLGSLHDFSDDLLTWAYERQCQCDPENKPYYLDCLTGIANGRESADLQTKVALVESAGEYGQQAIEQGYHYFGLDYKTPEEDDHIMGLYKSRIESAPRTKDECKKHLLIIAKARNSDKIAALANDRAMTYEEAMDFLNVSTETPPDMVQASAVAIASDGDTTKAARAMRVIANKRNDYHLQQAATDMESGTTTNISIDEAYRRLQVKDRTAKDELVFMYYQELTKDVGAGSRDHYAEALRAIALERSSTYLFAKLDDPNAIVAPARSTSDQPIGLDNIGNTCYLNSLLQYYYTVKAIRDVVMNFQDHRMPLGEEDIKKKRVGGRSVAKAEITKAQKFVDELHSLFENLKTASTSSIKPTRDLAELTLFSSAAAANFRRASVSSPRGVNIAASSSTYPIYGPEPRPQTSPARSSTAPVKEDLEMIDHPGDKNLENGSVSSEATLVNMDTLPTYNEAVRGGTESSPTTETGDDDQPMIVDGKDLEGDAIMLNGEDGVNGEKVSSAPEKPPPVPPRNKQGLVVQINESKEQISDDDLWRFGSQQDVTEVIGNVMFRLQCAIKPTSIDERSGEQIDIIRDTFYGSNVVYSQKAQTLERKVEAFASLNVFPAFSGPRDIYEALDVFFDEQFVHIDNTLVPQHSSIDKLPPILQIQIQRTQFDQVKQLASKNQNPVTFPETIYLDRYMDADPESSLMHRRRDTWKWKSELRKLEARQESLKGKNSELAVPDALLEAKNLVVGIKEENLTGIPIEPGLPEAIAERAAEIVEELETINTAIDKLKRRLSEQFMDMHQYEYKLQTVFIHRGEAGGGHYWIYIYDFENDIWRKYNDDHVDIVNDRKEIFEPHQIGGGTPYYLAYVRSQDKTDLVQAVYRDVPDAMDVTDTWAGEMEDEGVVMQDDDNRGVRHVEHVKPRPLRPKPPISAVPDQAPLSIWEAVPTNGVDANGKPW
ncbi:Ubiquitin carboxyl-terminal hydrolase [Lachnellula hyalina]|uniref:ubiquitinyl hydrolase 1 n=1 Tax=Lachnellula hyalina TaxID=1316788 RepID=A0A8H8R1M5_9HELO|nr:Ubiquitin carboxyl-terminal hydrolase [Lachnellula hyalina]TVY26416.1 Ubiquitin carboxyl-terminal hydrolase [Lachnellula hyalina]